MTRNWLIGHVFDMGVYSIILHGGGGNRRDGEWPFSLCIVELPA